MRGGGKQFRETRRFGCRRATPSGAGKAAQTLSADDWVSGVRMQLKLLACHIQGPEPSGATLDLTLDADEGMAGCARS